MSREIKFRCWNAFSSHMHQWKEMVDKNKIHLLNNKNKSYVCEQYTGLKDKNGVEIYEGDIVASHEVNDGYCPFIAPVVFDNAKWMVSDINSDEHDCLIEYHFDVEVIGNIHQNPGLLN